VGRIAGHLSGRFSESLLELVDMAVHKIVDDCPECRRQTRYVESAVGLSFSVGAGLGRRRLTIGFA
jgi:hypothetical protein